MTLLLAAVVVGGFVLALVAGTTARRVLALIGLGVLLAVVVFVFAYISASPDDPGSCSDCGYYWGRWWEPYFTLFILGFYFVSWCAAVVIGYFVRGRFERRRPAAT